MARCELCHNDYDKTFEVIVGGKSHTFDSFECAIHVLAPACAHCGCRVIGHGVEANDAYFCCAHCARQSGVRDLHDRSSENSAQSEHAAQRGGRVGTAAGAE